MDEIDDVFNYSIETIAVDTDAVFNFRINPSCYISDENQASSTTRYPVYEDTWEDDYEEDDDVDIIQSSDNNFELSMRIPKLLYGFIIGFKGSTRKKLESETGSQIKVPQKSETDAAVIIRGPNPKAILKCKCRIEMILMDARFKQPFTHFISIPMTGNKIQEQFAKFKAAVLNLGVQRGVDESIFQNSKKLHLTIGTLVLGDEEEFCKASNLLLKLKTSITDQLISHFGSLKLAMKGLEYMNDDPSEVDVLYAKVQVENNEFLLQQIGDELVDYFVEEGLMFQKYDKVKLHVTLMNTLFRKDLDGGKCNTENEHAKRFEERETFDAQKILRELGDWNFGLQDFTTIHISIRKTTHPKTGYYKSLYAQELIDIK